jgi:hypothetical protein
MLSYSLSPWGEGWSEGLILSLKGEGVTYTSRWRCPDDTLRIANLTEADYPVWDNERQLLATIRRPDPVVYGYGKRLYILSL